MRNQIKPDFHGLKGKLYNNQKEVFVLFDTTKRWEEFLQRASRGAEQQI